ncbi:AIPR family protein [Mucilaginibacter sp. UC70_90]
MNFSVQDFAVINTHVEKYKSDYGFSDSSNAFYFFALNLLFGLQDDEIRDSITDNHYLKTIGNVAGHDRGIDAVFIDESDSTAPIIHFFNFKYTTSFNKTQNHFPSNEIDKILSFLNALFSQDNELKTEINPVLYSKVEEIWELFKKLNPSFIFHICSNLYFDFEENEKRRFETGINKYSNFKITYHNIHDFVNSLTRSGKIIVDANIRAIDKNYFEKSDGDIRGLIVNIDVKDLIRIVLDNEDLRKKADIEDYEILKGYQILEDAFEDNIRVYLKQRTKINKNIKTTALSSESHRFFYFNNGITITCNSFSYLKSSRSPVIELKNIQVVNGSQTIHALYDAFLEESAQFDGLDILCRIYQTSNQELTTKIAEYTNSQNPVNSRDIRSIDYNQIKLEKELEALGFNYERKKGQYSNHAKNTRIDAEKVGQILMAFFNKLPSEAKNSKRLVFAEKYEEIFNDEITADKVLLSYQLFEKIELDKNAQKEKFISGIDENEKSSYISYASYWILYFLAEFAEKLNIELALKNFQRIWDLKEPVLKLIEILIKKERQTLFQKNDTYTHTTFFKYNRPKKIYEDLSNEEIDDLIKPNNNNQ